MGCKEIDKLVQRGELSSSTLQQAAMLVDTIKDIYTIDAMQDGAGEYIHGSSGAVPYSDTVRYSRAGNYPPHTNAYGNHSRGRYGYDGNKNDMIQRLENMASQAADPIEAAAYQRAMEQLRNV